MPSPSFSETPNGGGTIETYTVSFNKGVAERGIVIGCLAANGERFVANTPSDSALLLAMTQQEQVGRPGTVDSSNGMNTFIPL